MRTASDLESGDAAAPPPGALPPKRHGGAGPAAAGSTGRSFGGGGAASSRGADLVGAAAGAEAAPITFRMLREADIPELMELQRALFPVQYTESFYAKLFADGYYCEIGVSLTGEIATVASARVMEQFQDVPTREAYIMTLGVKETYRRRGLGTLAMQRMLHLLRTATRAEYAALHVKAANRAAVDFYESMGFSCDPDAGYLPSHYYIDGRHWDAFRYTKPLRSPLSAMLREYCAVL